MEVVVRLLSWLYVAAFMFLAFARGVRGATRSSALTKIVSQVQHIQLRLEFQSGRVLSAFQKLGPVLLNFPHI